MANYAASTLQRVAEETLLLYGADATVARDVAHSIVLSSLRGIDSHGFNLLPKILGRVLSKDGLVSQISEPAAVVVGNEEMPVAIVDAKLTPGQHSCLLAARLAADKAQRFGIGMVPVRNSTHFGSCAPFLYEVVSRGLVCMVGSNSTQTMAVFGASRANLGNMPIGFAAPVADGLPPFLFDFCCAVMSFGKLNRLKAAGEAIPPEAFQKNEAAEDSALYTNLAAIENLGLPFGGFKGANIAMMVECLSGLLSFGNHGAGTEVMRDGALQGPSHFVLAIDPSKFGTEGQYQAHMKAYLEELKASSPDIAYAGERAAATTAKREMEGVPVSAELRAEVTALIEAKGGNIAWD
eukprot:TRINITY_DN29406_c0_g1_i1.p1 TRINITY_DN29406_c0_g1~~TRINITY_DN29406_c0_g1_i1.p1  ORF type:complete len:351 (-),score=40.55 TRINITY_DN29406_c0_g1_i1:93-1145(-)